MAKNKNNPETVSTEGPDSGVRVAYDPNSLAGKLAQVLYYDHEIAKGEKDVSPYEAMAYPDQDVWNKRAYACLAALDKLNKRVVDVTAVVSPKESEERRRHNHTVLSGIIRDFNKGLKTTKPELYPCEELAYKILA